MIYRSASTHSQTTTKRRAIVEIGVFGTLAIVCGLSGLALVVMHPFVFNILGVIIFAVGLFCFIRALG